MILNKNNLSPWTILNKDQKEKALNSTIKINGCLVKLKNIDELEFHVDLNQLLNLLSQEQIDEILTSKIVEIEYNVMEISQTNDEFDEDANSKISYSNKQIKSRSPYEELNEEDKRKILNAKVRVPGYYVKFGEFIKNELETCKYLSRDEINKMLNGETVTFFKDLVESLDDFIKRKGVTINSNEN
ncbi:hypothetical protein PVAND_014355 [Polypedilum vanderplanki]|uniref:Uncharacterized protein n=1 Tax=Polypedilum vanderplanki TaxID=319348 RepID=A0A9J6CTR2_POLVA|nr:hypothetical protein PVAND_014355 [Polypedilum vanderplanki]